MKPTLVFILLLGLSACGPSMQTSIETGIAQTQENIALETPIPTTAPLETLPAAESLSDFPVVWVRQVGTSLTDNIGDVVADSSGFVYMSCLCSLAAPQPADQLNNPFIPQGSTMIGRAATVIKFNLKGQIVWQKSLDPGPVVISEPVAAVDTAGNVILVISGFLDGVDYAYVVKLDAEGNQMWMETLSDHHLSDVAVDSEGNIFVGGRAQFNSEKRTTTFVRKYTPEGEEDWTSLLNPADAFVNGLTLHVVVGADEHINVVGSISGAFADTRSLGGNDVFIQNYNPHGEENWLRQFGTSDDDFIQDAAMDAAGGLYLSFESAQPIVAKYDASGSQLWIKQLVSPGTKWIQLTTDQGNNVYVLLNHNWPKVPAEAEVQKLDAIGTPLWSMTFPSSWPALPWFLANDGSGNIFLAGETVGSLLGQTNSGNYDVFVLMFTP